jgi:ParB family chromosome partitioning protein
MKPTGRPALGKGLAALLPPPRFANLRDDYFSCAIDRIDADPAQPRQHFDPSALDELVRSIKEKGILQPLIVRRAEADRFVVVAGERRLRAARRAGLTEIPVLVKDVATAEALEIALIENLQREDLNPVEEAQAYARLLERPGYTQEVVAHRVGKDRSTIANAIRLLQLSTEEQAMLAAKKLTAGHARALLAVADPTARSSLSHRILDEQLSVREAEAIARASTAPTSDRGSTPRRQPPLQPYYDTVAGELASLLETEVEVRSRGRRGQLILHFRSVEELRRLRAHLARSAGGPRDDQAQPARDHDPAPP